jgi:PAS domain S-box-containing protein
MRRRPTGLGAKLNLSLLAFFIVLGAATSAVLLVGFNRTQDDASDRSEEALEELGKLALQAVVGGAAEQGGLQFESAAEIGQQAARYLETFRRVGAFPPPDPTLSVSPTGQYFDPDPERTSDLLVWSTASLEDPAVLDELAYTAALDAMFDTLFRGFQNEVGGRNFDPNAIAFLGANGVNRYYPPRGLHELITRDLDPSPLFETVGPANNPERRTIWGSPYEDSAGEGLVVTAETPVYDGDTLRGAIQVDLLIQRLIDQINGIKPTANGFAFYIDSAGVILESDSYPLIQAESESNVSLGAVLDAMRSDAGAPGVAVEKLPFNGEDYFLAYTPMPSLGGSFAVAAPVSEITAEAAAITAGIGEEGDRTLRVMLGAMGALLVGGLVASSYLNRRVLLRPIAELLAGTRAVGAGDLGTAIPVRSTDELGALAEGFNLMTANLNESESRYKRIFDSATDGLTISRLDGTIVEANPAACAMHGYDQAEFLALPVAAHIHPDFLGALSDEFIEATRAGRPHAGRAVDLRKDGTQFDVDVRTIPFQFQGEPHFLSILRDVTAEVHAEQLLEQRVDERTRELRLLLDVSQNVASTLNLEELARRILEQLLGVLPYGGAAVILIEGADLVVLEASDSSGVRDEVTVGRRFRQPVPGPAGDAVQQRVAVIVEDVLADPTLAAQLHSVAGPAASGRSWLAAPLVVQDRVLGVLTLWSTEPGVYGPEHADLAMAVANQAAVAIENARLFQRASAVAALEERQRLARELHDSVSQALYGIALGAQTARQLLDSDPSKAIQPVDYVMSLAEAGLAEMRALIFELRPESLATEGLVSALEKAAAATQARYGLTVEAKLGIEPEAPLGVKEALYRIAQEAMHNTVKHAHATRIDLELASEAAGLRLAVADDGLGFDAAADFPGHLGLQSMRERMIAVGGSLAIDSAPGAGTRIVATASPAPAS